MNVKSIKKLLHRTETATVILLILMVAVIASLSGNFFEAYTIRSNIISWTPLILLAMGQSFVIIGGGLDLSNGPAMSLILCTLTAVMHADSDITGVKALFIGLLVALGIGVINGFVVGYLRVPALIATFATSYIWLGAALFVMPTPGGECVNWMRIFYDFQSVESLPEGLKQFGAVIPSGLILIIIGIIVWVVLSRKKFGRYLYAVGSDRDITYQSGINSAKMQLLTYVINALFIYGCALFYAAQNQAGSARIGDPLTLQSVAAVVVGGVALSGGTGKVYMAAIGAVIMSLVNRLIYILELPAEYQVLVSGTIIILAITISTIYETMNAKAAEKREVN